MENQNDVYGVDGLDIVENSQRGYGLPVAYLNPTPSNPSSSPVYINFESDGSLNSPTTYSSNFSFDGLSSPIPSAPIDFHDSQPVATRNSLLPFQRFPYLYAAQIGPIFNKLITDGYSEQDLDEVNGALNTLARFGVLGIALGFTNGVSSVFGNLGMPNLPASIFHPNFALRVPNQWMYTNVNGIRGMDGGPNYAFSSMGSGLESETSSFSPRGILVNGVSGSGFHSRNTSPSVSHSNDQYLVQARRLRRITSAPISSVLPINRNSFGLGAYFTTTGNSYFRESSTPNASEVVSYRQFASFNELIDVLGPYGVYIEDIERSSGARIQISNVPFPVPGGTHVVTIIGQRKSVYSAQFFIERRLNAAKLRRARRN